MTLVVRVAKGEESMRVLAGIAVALLFACGLPEDTAAQTSCSAFQAQCAARCKQRVPDDKNCVSDHCSPKLAECRVTACWQEGNAYGGKRVCNLKK